MSARPHAADLYPLKRDPVRRYVFALVLLFVVTTLLLSITEATLRINTRQLEQALENQQARRELGQIVLRELFKLEVILNQFPALRDDLDLGVQRSQFDSALTKIKTVLGVLQRGGRFVDFRPTNFDNTNQISETIDYTGPGDGYVIAAIEITPKLIEIEHEGKRIFTLVESQILEGHDLNTPLIRNKVLSLLKHVQPTLLRCRESANKIYYESVMDIATQKAAIQTAIRWYAGIRVCVIGGIGLLGIVLCVRTLRRIGEIMDQRRRAELATSEAHDNLELILNTLPVGVALIDSQERVQSINPAGLDLIGYSTTEAVVGRPSSEIFSDDPVKADHQDNDQVNDSQTETRLRCQNGEELAVIKKSFALKMLDEIVRLEAFMDISARLRVEKALRDQQHFTKTVLDFAPVGIVVIDAEEHRIIDINATALELFETDRSDAVGTVCHDFICPNKRGNCPITDHGNNVDEAECELVSKRQHTRNILKSVVVTTLGGRQCLVESFVDISALKAAQKALLQESSKFSAVIEGMGEGLVLTDDEGHITEVNPCFCAMAGLSREACLGRPLASFYPASVQADLETAAERFQLNDDKRTLVKENVRIFDLDAIVRLQPIHTAPGYAGMVFNVVDVSPLVGERRRAEAASRAKSDFLANMSHELRTPLNHIIGFTELVVDQHFGELNEVQAGYLSDVLTSGRHLLSLINDILDLAKVEAGSLELQPNAFDLTEVLTNGLVLVKEKALKHGIKVTFQPPPCAIGIMADERKVKQILYNLLSNAVKFTPDGGAVDLSVCLSETQPGPGVTVEAAVENDPSEGESGWILLCVRDTGIGLSGDDLERIFKPFEQVDQSTGRRYEGTGLGLSLTRQMVALHGGCIWAESDGESRGSRFYVSLPRCAEVAA